MRRKFESKSSLPGTPIDRAAVTAKATAEARRSAEMRTPTETSRSTRDERRRRVVAVHEAGHAVAAVRLLGWRSIRLVTIVADGNAAGRVELTKTALRRLIDPDLHAVDVKTLDAAVSHAVFALAGEAAQRRLAPGSYRRYQCEHDLASMGEMLFAVTSGARESDRMAAWLDVRAAEFVKRWAYEIEAVARSLLDRARLTGEEVRDAMRSAEIPEFELPAPESPPDEVTRSAFDERSRLEFVSRGWFPDWVRTHDDQKKLKSELRSRLAALPKHARGAVRGHWMSILQSDDVAFQRDDGTGFAWFSVPTGWERRRLARDVRAHARLGDSRRVDAPSDPGQPRRDA